MQRKRGFTLIELLVVIAIIAILAAILFPVFQKVRENARASTCASNLQQIGLAVVQYTQDFDESYPGGIDTNYRNAWPSTVQPYVKSVQVFRCPDDTDTKSTKNGGTYDNVFDGEPPVSYASNGFAGWDGKENFMFGVMGHSGAGASWITDNIKPLGHINRPAETIMVAERHNDDVRKYYGGDGGNGSFAGTGSIITGFSWEDSNSPMEIPDGALTNLAAAYPLGPNGCVSVKHVGQTRANFLFCDGHVKSMLPYMTDPDPTGNKYTDPGNMWNGYRN